MGAQPSQLSHPLLNTTEKQTGLSPLTAQTMNITFCSHLGSSSSLFPPSVHKDLMIFSQPNPDTTVSCSPLADLSCPAAATGSSHPQAQLRAN